MTHLALAHHLETYCGHPLHAQEHAPLAVTLSPHEVLGAMFLPDDGEVLLYMQLHAPVDAAEFRPPPAGGDEETSSELPHDDGEVLRELGERAGGALALHIDGKTAVATLGLRLPLQPWSAQEFAAIADELRDASRLWEQVLQDEPDDDAFPAGVDAGLLLKA